MVACSEIDWSVDRRIRVAVVSVGGALQETGRQRAFELKVGEIALGIFTILRGCHPEG